MRVPSRLSREEPWRTPAGRVKVASLILRPAPVMNKKYQVFISSTFVDLIQERQSAMRAVLDLGHIPSGMEIFPAADVEQFEYIKKVIDECDYYVLIIGARYGSVDEAGLSFHRKGIRLCR